jgi:hypothetical protein
MKALLGSLLLAVSMSAIAKPPTMKLDCAKVPKYKTEAERQYLSAASGGGDIYAINVTFITKRPDDKLADKTLRECISASLKLDSKKDILATAWFRPIAGTDPNDDEIMNPYGSLKFISYKASDKSVSVRSTQFKGK